VQTAEFWWDLLNKHKISPSAMTSYSRDEANAIFQAGDAAFTVADTTFYGTFNDPAKSKVAGKIGIARFPLGPSNMKHRSWIDIWGWSIPKAVPADRQAAAKLILGDMLADKEAQIEQWQKVGAPPPNTAFWKDLEQSDPLWRQLSSILIDSDHVHDAYYFRAWASVHKAYSDTLIRAMKGPREDIAKALATGVEPINAGAVKQ
jgi:ABC-type glycerol-3-phosphate transport system substrate-binding protein